MPKLLIVLTGADAWTLNDGDSHPTGFWAEELLAPLRVFRDAGLDVTFATPGGVRPTVDEASLSADAVGGEERSAELREELDALGDELYSPMRLEDLSPDEYSAVFIPGGHGPMEDLAVSPELGALLEEMLDDDKVISVVCHSPAGLLSATRPDGTWAFAGRNLSGFSDADQKPASSAEVAEKTVPALLRERVRLVGGRGLGLKRSPPGSRSDKANPAAVDSLLGKLCSPRPRARAGQGRFG